MPKRKHSSSDNGRDDDRSNHDSDKERNSNDDDDDTSMGGTNESFNGDDEEVSHDSDRERSSDDDDGNDDSDNGTSSGGNCEGINRMAGGAGGKEVGAVGGIRDKAVLALARGRMKTNQAFRERVHDFLRAFGTFFEDTEPRLKNHEITDLADTRTARCFMVMARATGAFD